MQMELDFGHIESISEARTMLKTTIPKWEKKIFQEGIEQGIEQGMDKGRVVGKIEGQTALFQTLLTQRFGTPAPEVYQMLENATPEELEIWTLRILDALNIDDVFKH